MFIHFVHKYSSVCVGGGKHQDPLLLEAVYTIKSAVLLEFKLKVGFIARNLNLESKCITANSESASFGYIEYYND